MSYSNIGRVSIAAESTFGTASGGTYYDVRIVEGSLQIKLGQTMLENRSIVARLHDTNAMVQGSKFGTTVSFDMYVEGLGTGLVSGQAYTHPLTSNAVPFYAGLGRLSNGDLTLDGSVVADNLSTSSAINITNGHGVRFSAGGAVVINGEMREIESVATGGDPDVITLKMALSAAPAQNDVVYNCATYYVDDSFYGTDSYSNTLRVIGGYANDQFLFVGCVPTIEFTTDLDGLLIAKVTYHCASWSKTSGLTLAGASYLGGGPLAAKSGYVWYQTVATSTRAYLTCDKFTANPGLTAIPVRSLEGVQTVSRFRQGKAKPTCSFEFPILNGDGTPFDTMFTDFGNNAAKAVLLQFGTAPIVGGVGTGVVGLSVPNARFSEPPTRTTGLDLSRVSASFYGDEDADTSGNATDLQYSCFRIHVA